MAFVIALSDQSVIRNSGGPFAAAIFDASNRLVSAGINLVTTSGLSMAHAEMVAISLAQGALGDWNLARSGGMRLYTSCEPCAMCFGAVPWSGVTAIYCGASKQDAEDAGFDEGDKPGNWIESLRSRGIAVETGLLAERAARVFRRYREAGGVIYNAGSDD